MHWRSFVLIMALAMTAYGAEMHAYCDDSHPIICPKTAEYDSHIPTMQKLYYKNKDLINMMNPKKDLEDISELTQGDEENCEYRTTWETPFAIKSLNTSTSHLVVQLGQHFTQRIRYTRCESNGKPCFASLFTNENPFRCKEKMATVSLYIYDPEVKAMSYKMFEVPVACACKYRVLRRNISNTSWYRQRWELRNKASYISTKELPAADIV